jgi:Vacuolar protein sorting-associated protein
MKPIEGAESEGAFGFIKGVGKGLVGYVSFVLITDAKYVNSFQSCDQTSRWCI